MHKMPPHQPRKHSNPSTSKRGPAIQKRAIVTSRKSRTKHAPAHIKHALAHTSAPHRANPSFKSIPIQSQPTSNTFALATLVSAPALSFSPLPAAELSSNVGPSNFAASKTALPFNRQAVNFSTHTATEPTNIPNNCSDPLITQLFTTLNKGLEPMCESNPGMTITTESDVYECDLGRDLGSYHFTRSSNESFILQRYKHVTPPVVMMMSPISGNSYQYFFDAKRLQQWVSIDDEHYMVEMITRELLKKCYGYPMF